MPWRLTVIDGADKGRYFPLGDTGSVVIGNSHKHCDVCLHDLLVARVHCQVDAEDGRVGVTALTEDKDTLVNGQKVRQADLVPGEVLRVGNTHMRLDPDKEEDPDDIVEADEVVDPDEVLDAEVVDDGPIEVVEVVAEAEEVIEAELKPEPVPRLPWKELEKLRGVTVGHFEIGDLVGRGITAVTFRARDREARREVALKVIGPDFPANGGELQQFAKAIQKVAQIAEDHLVPWYAAGRTNKYVWISQELVEGESLAHVLQRSQTASTMLKWRNALKLGLDLAKALDCLHKRHIVHGDLTPANVIIGVDLTAKLNDTLYAEALKDSQWYGERLERKLLAQLPYLAPERLEEGDYWDGLADIYSLGVLVYTRLTGQLPYRPGKPGDMIEAIRSGNLIKPRDIIRGCPERFETVVLKMLAHNQEDRYQTPEQLLHDLEGLKTAS
jgi:uncharacterized protein with HEPN domain